MAPFVRRSDWKTSLSFNGGHSKTEKIIETEFKKSKNAGSFNQENVEAMLLDIERKIKSGELKSGDQLLLTIDNHGEKAESLIKTHRLAMALEKNELFPRFFSLDRLESIIDLASQKGIKIGIIDLSCFSGNTLNLKSDQACVITASGPDHYSYSNSKGPDFGREFLKSLAKGKNLEEVFLSARKKGESPDFPMISTPEGRNLQNLFYQTITSYLNFNDDRAYDFTSMYYLKNAREVGCSLDNQLQQLNELLEQAKKLEQVAGRSLDFSSLMNALRNYRDFQKKYEMSLIHLSEARQEITDILNNEFSEDGDLWKGIDHLSFIEINDEDSLTFNLKRLEESKSDVERESWQKNIERLKRQISIKNKIWAKISVESKRKIKEHQEVLRSNDLTYELALRVGMEAKKMYEKLYLQSMTKVSNPCRDFVL